MRNNKGFTLIELIIVIAIIALLAAATFVAVDPAKRIGEAQNAQRWADVTAIASAWMNYMVDNNGATPTTTQNLIFTIAALSTSASSTRTCTATSTINGTIWLTPLVTSGYLGAIPYDPNSSYVDGTTSTGYYLRYDANNTLTVGACDTYGGGVAVPIKVVR